MDSLLFLLPLPLVFLLAPSVLLYFDIHILEEAIASVGSTSTRRNFLKIPRTFPGRALYDRIMTLGQRIEFLQNQLRAPSEVLSESTLSPEEATHSSETLYEQYLRSTQQRFLAKVIAFIDIGPLGGIQLYSRSLQDATLQEYIKTQYRPYLFGGKGAFGVLTYDPAKKILDLPCVYGMNKIVAYPIEWAEGDTARRAVFWLGYGAAQSPTEFEILWAKHLTQRIALEMSSLHQVLSLNTRVQEAEQETRHKIEFLTQVSHDIRSPLSNVKSILHLFETPSAYDDARDLVEVALNNCNRVGELVQDVLDLSRHQAGKLETRPEVFELRRCVQEVADEFRISARIKGIALEMSPSSEDARVHADRSHTRRIISNLIGNALKYTRAGSIELHLLCDANHQVRLLVKDTGCGMSDEDMKYLFTPFHRFSDASVEGVGLGLPLTKILVELNGGSLEVRSEIGEGSEFEVALPLASQLQIPSQSKEEKPKEQAESQTLLVVDDDPDFLESLSRGLESFGYQVLRAFSMFDAEKRLKDCKVDVLLSDWQMPHGGAERLIRFVSEQKIHVRVMVLSGKEGIGDARGVEQMLLKPVTARDVRKVISRSSFEGKRNHPAM